MNWYDSLVNYGLVSEKTSVIFSESTRDNKDAKVYKDLKSGIIYLKDYYVEENTYEMGNYDRKRKINYGMYRDCDRRVDTLKQFYIGKNIIDFGCGYSYFLSRVKNYTNYCAGIDLDVASIKKLKSENIDAYFSLDDIPDNSLDTVFMFHSMEHLKNPIQILEKINCKLKKFGNLIVEVPHARDFLISKVKSKKFIEKSLWTQHLILHTRNSLEMFLDKSGYHSIFVKGVQRYPISNHFNWIVNELPNGHMSEFSCLETKELNSAYENSLSNIDCTDTLVAICQK